MDPLSLHAMLCPCSVQPGITRVPLLSSISQWFTQRVLAWRITFVPFEGGNPGTVDEQTGLSNSAAPGPETGGWVRPPKGILTRLIDY